MTLIQLIVLIALVVAFVYVAQHVPAPWSYLLYAIAAVALLVAILNVLGFGGISLGAVLV